MENRLYIGPDPDIELPRCGCLLLDGREWTIPAWRRPRPFDPLTCSFNPLADLDYRKACDIVDVFDALFDKAGATTLTKEAGLEFIADLLETKPASFEGLADMIEVPDKKSSPGHIRAYNKVRRILRSPLLRKVFCERPNFSFKRGSVNHARINRAELGPFDANALGLFLNTQFSGQIIVPNFGPYARPFHTALIEEGRLIEGVRMLSQLKGELLGMAMLMEKIAAGCTHDDAVEIAKSTTANIRRTRTATTPSLKGRWQLKRATFRPCLGCRA